ncbi:MAG: DUF5398 domain-containing protein [Verrucomicrobia bacterium]|nr:DUF5398 domain-containing protein [Verrucomicrobiota bacterium]NDE63783.1 needle chaperone SctE [Chlamydiota bacterium]
MLGQNKPAREIFKFDLEKELKDPKKRAEIQDKCEKRIQELKAVIRQGASPSEFEDIGHLLHGYVALEKIIKQSARWS